MEILKTLIWIVQMISAVAIVVLILIQHGKGAAAGATFGSGGGSNSLFGASGSSNFLSRTTAIFATVFFVTTFVLVFLSGGGRIGDLGVVANVGNASPEVVESITNQSTNINVNSGIESTKINLKNEIPQ